MPAALSGDRGHGALYSAPSSMSWKSALRRFQPQLLLSSLCHNTLGLIFLSPFDFFPSNYLVVALSILVKGHKINAAPLSCVSKLLSALAFHVFSDH